MRFNDTLARLIKAELKDATIVDVLDSLSNGCTIKLKLNDGREASLHVSDYWSEYPKPQSEEPTND